VKDALGRFACTRELITQPVKLPETVPLTDEATEWLLNRGITVPATYGFAEGAEGMLEGRIVIPFCRPSDFQPVYWQARSYKSRLPKYFNAPATPRALYYLPAPASATLVLVEGVFDAIAIRQLASLDVAALLGTSLDITAGRMLLDIAPARIVVWLDRDALPKAIKLASKLRGLLGTEVGMVFSTSSKDPADLCLTDPAQAMDLLDQSMGHQVAL
jgi:DNA primase